MRLCWGLWRRTYAGTVAGLDLCSPAVVVLVLLLPVGLSLVVGGGCGTAGFGLDCGWGRVLAWCCGVGVVAGRCGSAGGMVVGGVVWGVFGDTHGWLAEDGECCSTELGLVL